MWGNSLSSCFLLHAMYCRSVVHRGEYLGSGLINWVRLQRNNKLIGQAQIDYNIDFTYEYDYNIIMIMYC